MAIWKQIGTYHAQKYFLEILFYFIYFIIIKIKQNCVETMQYYNDCVEPFLVLKTKC
jgi:hypothetical protein